MEQLSKKETFSELISETILDSILAFGQKLQLLDRTRKFLLHLSKLLPKTQKVFYLGIDDEEEF